jgi:hypothetical protein
MTDLPAAAGTDAHTNEVAITEEMIEAGISAFLDYDSDYETPREAAEQIYEAMYRLSPEFRRGGPNKVAPALNVLGAHKSDPL